MAFQEKRAHYRLKIRVPVFVKGRDAGGEEFYELTHTTNVSARGATFSCNRTLGINEEVQIIIPAPVDVQSKGTKETEFKFPARITRIESDPGTQEQRVSVHFDRPLYV